jgi:hypothetical protein
MIAEWLSLLEAVATHQSVNSALGIHQTFMIACKKGMTVTAHFYTDRLFSGSDCEAVPADTGNGGLRIIFGVNISFHILNPN